MIPRTRPDIRWSDILSMLRSSGCSIEQFEAAFREVYAYREAVWFPTARVAIRAFLECAPGGEPARDVVAVSPFNCFAVAAGIVTAGCRPGWVGVGAGSYNEDQDLFAQAMRDPATLAGIHVPIWGIENSGGFALPAERRPVLFDYAMKGLDRTPAPLADEDAAVYSFSFGKPITSFQGGVLCSNEPGPARRWREWRMQHIDGRMAESPAPAALRMKLVFSPHLFGIAYRVRTLLSDDPGEDSGADVVALPPDLHPAPRAGVLSIGVGRLEEFDAYQRERAEQVRRYDQGLAHLRDEGFGLPEPLPWLSYYPILVEGRDALRRHLLARGIYTSAIIFDRLLPDYDGIRAAATWGSLDAARHLTRRVLQLPLFHGLTAVEQARIVDAISDWADGRHRTG